MDAKPAQPAARHGTRRGPFRRGGGRSVALSYYAAPKSLLPDAKNMPIAVFWPLNAILLARRRRSVLVNSWSR